MNASHGIPPVFGYFVMAVLAVIPRTFALRVVLWPLIALLSVHAAISVDMSFGEPDKKFRNTLFMFSMILILTRTLDWSFSKEPLAKRQPPVKGCRSTLTDALDLAFSLRGHGWEWTRSVHIPRETRPTDRMGFTTHAIVSLTAHALLSGIFHIAIRSLLHLEQGTRLGVSIFDDCLPFHTRYIRAGIITTCTWAWSYTYIQTCYDTCTIIGVLLLGQDPVHWPPAFDSPWRATSLADFWGRRWHQFFRRTFLIQGGYPLAFLVGRAGLVIGTFLSSGVLHHIAAMMLDNKLEAWRNIIGFELMALGILVEGGLERWTKRKVGGIVGWLWTTTWLLFGFSLIVDGFVQVGLFSGHLSFLENVVPQRGRIIVERLCSSDF